MAHLDVVMNSPLLPRGIQHIGVTAPDLDAVTRFIVDRLGAGVVYDGLTADDEPRRGQRADPRQGTVGNARRAPEHPRRPLLP
ncbi:VOC family protein [Kocuria marina]|uniref:hypothetical protein n=1 Tax=Kocuria marina TaxID=223184 RepID=UPI00296FCA49